MISVLDSVAGITCSGESSLGGGLGYEELRSPTNSHTKEGETGSLRPHHISADCSLTNSHCSFVSSPTKSSSAKLLLELLACMVHSQCFKPLKVGIICYVAISN